MICTGHLNSSCNLLYSSLLQLGSNLVLENELGFCTFCMLYDNRQCEQNKITACKILKKHSDDRSPI